MTASRRSISAEIRPPKPSASRFQADGLLLVGHGTRDPRGQRDFAELAEKVRARVPLPFAAGFLELAEPTLQQAVDSLLKQGCRRLAIAPALLFSAGHAQDDIPHAVRAAVSQVSGIELHFTYPLECLPGMIELAHLRWEETIRQIPQFDKAESLLILVGRGSSDLGATAQMRRLAVRCRRRYEVGKVMVAFAAVAAPPLKDVIDRATNGQWRQIVVQPYLAFTGYLWESIRAEVAARAALGSERNWHVTAPLGPHPLFADALVERVIEGVSWDDLARVAVRGYDPAGNNG